MVNRQKGLSRAACPEWNRGKSRGFTLIELLVVIAIIGILSSVVLASLNTARSKGNDGKVKAQLSSVRASAEVYHSNVGTYTTSSMSAGALPCTGAMFIDSASGMLQYTGTAATWPTGTTLSCQASGVGYAVSASLSTSGQFWCIDSTGQSKQTTAHQVGGDVTC